MTVVHQIADITGDQLLALINFVHSAQVESVAAAFDIADEAGLQQLRQAPDKPAMIRVATQITTNPTAGPSTT